MEGLESACCLATLDNMPLDGELLRSAIRAGERVADAQREADLAKADYYRAIRRLHLAGATMREIASALNLSHQRVQQIIDANGGGRRWRRRRSGNDAATLACSFCGTHQRKTRKLIAGPGVFICDRCVTEARHIAAGNTATGTASLIAVGPRASGRCGFCGKDRGRVARLVTVEGGPPVADRRPGKYATASICNECLDLCDEIIENPAPT
jgi:ClpX C4-type zinc finger